MYKCIWIRATDLQMGCACRQHHCRCCTSIDQQVLFSGQRESGNTCREGVAVEHLLIASYFARPARSLACEEIRNRTHAHHPCGQQALIAAAPCHRQAPFTSHATATSIALNGYRGVRGLYVPVLQAAVYLVNLRNFINRN